LGLHFLPPKEFVAEPDAMARDWDMNESKAYTRWLATSHYENFPIVSFLLPKHLHQDFFNVYAFCRWADDLGDEIGDSQESLRLLYWWRGLVNRMFAGHASHPVFVALLQTVRRHSLPEEPFLNLVSAFVQDQTVTRYRSMPQLLDYCRYSANPVGRLVLHLYGYSDRDRQWLSDSTCTALQLTNMWQDVARDLKKGRIYIPEEVLGEHSCRLSDVEERRCTDGFRAAMRQLVGYTRGLFHKGLPLTEMVDRKLALDLALFSRGGLRILDKIEEQNHDVFKTRPVLTKSDRAKLLLSALCRWYLKRPPV
jgi:squalene synthase HpnC